VADTALTAPARRWQFIAIAAALILVAGLGLYALVHDAADETIMLALPQSPAPAPRAAAETPALAPARPLDATGSPAGIAPVASTPPPAPAPSAVDTPVASVAPVTLAAPAARAPADIKTAAPAVESVAYKLAIKPWGTVYVDGRERGVSPPMKRLVLAPGKHKIRIVNPSFPDHLINLDSARNKSGTLEHDFTSAKK
jgi:hypothetical protein